MHASNKYMIKFLNKFKTNKFIEGQLDNLFSILYYLFYIIKNFILVNDFEKYRIDDICNDIKKKINEFNNYLKISIFKDLNTFMFFFNTLIYNNEINIEKFIINLFDNILNNKYSLIYKQIYKQEYKEFKNIDYWKSIYITVIEKNSYYENFTNDENIKEVKELNKLTTILSDFLSDFLSFDDKNFHLCHNYIRHQSIEFNALFKIIKFIYFPFFAPLLDIYTLLRIFKQPDGGQRASLCFCYFGNNHIINILSILTNYINKYELIHSIGKVINEKDQVQRCLDFEEKKISLNLTKELKDHNLYI